VVFNQLGLVIVDEEHRFGVKQKEAIKSISKGVDVLFMSATPIPRTLQLSISGLKSISTIFTAPFKRKPITTIIKYSNREVVVGAITREIHRGGQVFIVNNNVDNIPDYSEKIRRWAPFARVEFLHGQETSLKIEKKMSDFILRKINVLVCSSIIEAGIDVPGANTIIIENSHLFGLAQLYQLRGRVGRSAINSYAFLLVPKNCLLSAVARKRLKTIEQNTALGSGYGVASVDLEMRGSGALFGYKQSGNYRNIGKELYRVLVEDSIQSAVGPPGDFLIPIKDVLVNVFDSCFIPEEYILHQVLRFELYKKIFSAHSNSYLFGLRDNVLNRFGPIPPSVKNLFRTQHLRILCARVGIVKINNKNENYFFVFSGPGVDVPLLINISTSYFKHKNIPFSFSSTNPSFLELKIKTLNINDSYKLLTNFLNKLRK